ncbi:thioredoxin fold domain-containing protein [Alteromonas facilis]|uniref:thioredoxin fold domain-containing protein n=1 Tax=Alteromonas facilis TaxID=2048004 RepID=UPI000C290142|nr:thioredoxin fold domain-containing protein [Alteromonas facilis]
MTLAGQKWTIWVRDILIGGAIVIAVLLWQQRDMLTSNTSVGVNNRHYATTHGTSEPLLADGKPTLVYFFAPWCQVCHLSIGNLEYIDNENIRIVRVALDYASEDDVLAFAQQHNIQAPILYGNEQLKSQFKVDAYPTYYMVNASHEIVSGTRGYSTAVGLKVREYLTQYKG